MAPQTTNAAYNDSVLEYGHGAGRTFRAAYNDSVLEYGHGYRTPQTTRVGYLDTQATWAANVTGTGTAGLIVKVGATSLTDAFARSWRDEYAGPGSWQFSLANDDADMPDFDDVVSFVEDGKVRFAGPVQAKRVTTYGPGEDFDKVTVLSGMGRLAVTDKSVVAPSRGWDAEPVEVTRSQSWVSVDFDDSSWLNSKRIRRVDIGTPYSPYRSIPEWYPDKTAWEIAPNRSDITGSDAPVGQWLARSTAISLSAGTIEVVFGANNEGRVFFDGALIGDVDNSPKDANRVRFDVSAGNHYLAASVVNFIRDTWFVASIYSVDSDGLLDDLLWSTDYNTMKALPYPATIPGFTAGEAIRILVEEMQAEGELTGLTLGFTDLLDTDGEPWSDVLEIATEVGRTLMEYLTSLAGWLIDVQMAPGSNVLRAWNWGTRGRTPGVTISATTNPATSEVEGLSFDGSHIRANRLRIRYKGGYTEVDQSGADPTVTAFLDLSEVDTGATARTIGRRELELRQDPSYAGSLTLAPVTSDPYDDFDNGDYVTHPANPSGGTSSRVRGITRTEDENGEETWALELHDVRQEVEERQENWLRRTAMGYLAGGSKVTSRRGGAIPPSSKVSEKTVAEFSLDGALTASTSPKRPAESSGNLIEYYASLTVAGTTATTLRVLKNGTSLGTLTLAAGETVAEYDLAAGKTYRNVDRYQVEVLTVGTGAEGLDVQVRAI